ncbi:MAG: hypothetical protein KIT09_19240 [Bryobacteraceae bacterium]|nr:hypothetical protein [Bryobacteraceae bacterium]
MMLFHLLFPIALLAAPPLEGATATGELPAPAPGVSVEHIRYDGITANVEFELVNQTRKSATAYSVRFLLPNGETPGQDYDFLPSVGLEGEIAGPTDDPYVHVGAHRPGQRRRFREHVAFQPESVRVVAIVYDDGAAVGDDATLQSIVAGRRAEARVIAYALHNLNRLRETPEPAKAARILRDLSQALAGSAVLVNGFDSPAVDGILAARGIQPTFRTGTDDAIKSRAAWAQRSYSLLLAGAAEALEAGRKEPLAIIESILRILEKKLLALASSQI